MLAYVKMAKSECRPWFVPSRFHHDFSNVSEEDFVSKDSLESPETSVEESANEIGDSDAPLCLVVEKKIQHSSQNKGFLPTPPGSPHDQHFSSNGANSLPSPLRVDIHRPGIVLAPMSRALQDQSQHHRLHGGLPLLSPADFLDNPIFARALASGAPKRTRGEKKPIPEEQKDIKYFERRKRNNQAAKKSRDARKSREDQIAVRATSLEKENAVLRAQLITLREEADSLRLLLIQKRSR